MVSPMNATSLPLLPESLTLVEIASRFSNADAAREYLESLRWPDGPICPHCGVLDEATKLEGKKHRRGLYKCRACTEQFTVTVNTVMEDSHIPLHKWLIAFYLMCSSKKGVSALQLQRLLGLGSYRTAWFLAHRVRYALKSPAFLDKLAETVEADETYIGGKKCCMGRGYTGNKTPVVSLVERGGRVRSQVMQHVTAENLDRVLQGNVKKAARLNTDELPAYSSPGRRFASHETVNHSAKEYVRHDKKTGRVATVNTAEGYFANLKRGLHGIYHSVGRQYLPQYLAEFDYRYNTRKITDGERTVGGTKKSAGKRLMLRRPPAAGRR
jgi:transposase-like protein